jgi:hypothetical protein
LSVACTDGPAWAPACLPLVVRAGGLSAVPNLELWGVAGVLQLHKAAGHSLWCTLDTIKASHWYGS